MITRKEPSQSWLRTCCLEPCPDKILYPWRSQNLSWFLLQCLNILRQRIVFLVSLWIFLWLESTASHPTAAQWCGHVRGASLWETGHDVGWQFSPFTENFLARHALLWLKSTTKIQPLSKYHPIFSFLNSSYFCSFFKYRSQSCRRGGTACWHIPW